jgi:hypothetical protein
VVDDEADAREMISTIVGQAGAEVGNGQLDSEFRAFSRSLTTSCNDATRYPGASKNIFDGIWFELAAERAR